MAVPFRVAVMVLLASGAAVGTIQPYTFVVELGTMDKPSGGKREVKGCTCLGVDKRAGDDVVGGLSGSVV